MMLMQLLFYCHLFICFQNARLWRQSAQNSFPQFSVSSNNVLVSFSCIWEELPSISLLYYKFFKCFLKTNKPKNPTKQPPNPCLLDYLSNCPRLSHYYSCVKLIQRRDTSCPMPEWLFEVEVFEGFISLHFFFVGKDPQPACGSLTVCGGHN